MRKTILAFSLAASFAAPLRAQDVQQEPALSFNAAVVSDYRYRGISQSRFEPALQGGVDYADRSTGMYAGAWLSTIKWTGDAGGAGRTEWDLYAGRRGQAGALSYDAGLLAYVYPANGLARVAGLANANTGEVYGQLGFGPAYAKYSLSLTNLFGVADSRRSGYLDLGTNVDLGRGLAINLHAGRQQVRHHGQASYSDWKLGLSQDFGVVTGSLALVGTNADRAAYASPADGRFLGRRALVATIARTF